MKSCILKFTILVLHDYFLNNQHPWRTLIGCDTKLFVGFVKVSNFFCFIDVSHKIAFSKFCPNCFCDVLSSLYVNRGRIDLHGFYEQICMVFMIDSTSI